jgi:hypothetical protein
MKKFTVGLSVLTLAVAVGCSGDSSEGPQAVGPREREQANESERVVARKPMIDETEKPMAGEAKQPMAGEAETPMAGEAANTFSLSVPFESVQLAQGEEKAVLIGINRGEDFREEVAIEVAGLPQGVTLETVKPVISQGDTEVELLLKSTADAALGDFTIKVTGKTASSGADFSKEVKLTVAEK